MMAWGKWFLASALACTTFGCTSEVNKMPAGSSAEEPASTASTEEGAGAPEQVVNEKDPALARMRGFIAETKVDTTSDNWRVRVPKPPQLEFPADKTYYWHMDTNHGPLKIRLLTSVAPMHASSTIYLTQLGYYDGLGFHRVIKGFMAQGGCPLGTGTGRPGYQYDGEFSSSVRHDRRGLLSMANAGPRTDGSQFFITFRETPHLDGKHTIFGEVVDGMQTVDAMEALASSNPTKSTPAEPIEIERAWITVE